MYHDITLTSSLRHLRRQYLLLFMAIILGTVILLAIIFSNGYRQEHLATEINLRNMVATLATRLDATFRRIQSDLEQIANEMPDEALLLRNAPLFAARIQQNLNLHSKYFPELNSYRSYDSNGDSLYNSGNMNAHTNVADRNYFNCMLTKPQTLCFSESLFGKISKKPTLVVAKALTKPDENFNGAIIAALDLTFITKLFASLNLGAEGTIALRSTDGAALRARWPEVATAINQPFKPDHILRVKLQAGEKTGAFHTISVTDNVARFYVYQCLENYPFIITAGQSPYYYLAQWREIVIITSSFAATTILIFGIILHSLWRGAVRNLEMSRRLNDTQFAMDRVGIAVSWFDMNGKFIYVNDAACSMLGYQRDELLALSIPDIDPNFTYENFSTLIAECRQANFNRFEKFNRSKDGRLIPVEITLYYHAGACGEAGRFISFIIDISERKAIEQTLLQTKEAAEAANRAKSVFLANMSHELRTPLNAILGFAQIMAHDRTISSAHSHALATIDQSGRHLLALINDVLEISRIEAGRSTVQNEPFDLKELLAGVAAMMRLRAEIKGLAFNIVGDTALPAYVVGDAFHLREVLINLIGNAVKYTDHGYVTLQLAQNTDQIHFAVHDSGHGIAATEQELIFLAFYQTSVGIAKGEGSGLGLCISREFVRLMGGELSVVSTLGDSSVFSFSLPLVAIDVPVGVIPSPGRVIGLAAGQRCYRILVAEDHRHSRELLTYMLENVGFEVRAVENGRQAVEVYQNWQPHFIWMDMRMPELDGYQATQQIRVLPGGERVKIVALTASAFQEDRDAIIAAGCDEVLAKPLEQEHLFRVMGKLLPISFRHDEVITPPIITTPLDCSKFPPYLRHELRNAAELLDITALQAIISRIQDDYPVAARIIAKRVDDFQLNEIIELCGNGHK